MKRLTLIWLMAIFMLSINSLYGRKEKLIKVGCVDLQKVFERSEGKRLAEKHLNKMRDDFAKKKEKMEEADAMELKIERKLMELRKFIDKSNQKLEDEENKLLEPLIEDIKDVVKAVSIKYGYNMILDKSTYVLYVDKDLDITDDVIDELKAKYRESKKK